MATRTKTGTHRKSPSAPALEVVKKPPVSVVSVPAANGAAAPAIAQETFKDLYEVGEIPPLGHIPKKMYAWAIRAERHGPPDTAMQMEVLPTW